MLTIISSKLETETRRAIIDLLILRSVPTCPLDKMYIHIYILRMDNWRLFMFRADCRLKVKIKAGIHSLFLFQDLK